MKDFVEVFNEYCKTAYEGVLYRIKFGQKEDAQYGNDLDKKFPIGGVTKLFTIACVLKLIENKKLILDTKLPVYLSEEECKGLCVVKGVDYSTSITIKDLLYQTSGLTDYFTELVKPNIARGDDSYTFEDKLNWTKLKNGIDKPGSKVAYYSNLNADLLTYIVEKSTGKKIMDVYKEFIFDPLELKNTYIPMDEKCYMPALFFDGRPMKRPGLLRSSYGSGGLISTAKDLLRFIVGFFNGVIFNKSLIDKLTNFISMSNGLDGVSYGGGLMRIKSKKTILGQLGYTGAFAFADIYNKVYYVGYLSQNDCEPINVKMLAELFEKA